MKNQIRTGLLLLVLFAGSVAKAQVPKLSSYPSAVGAVIFLDFDGHTVVNTVWNSPDPFYCGSSGLDNTQITTVFNRVAEDYRPFNINITTDSTVFLAAPLNRRMRVILTTSWEWFGAAGGVAYPGTFTSGDDTPCFVFASLLSNNVKAIADACSHEAGHTLGLFHQAAYNASCVKISDYYGGQGTGEIGWAPIMGVGYYQNTTQWYNGPNSYGCTNYQNDLTIITTGNGFGFRTDDHAATFAAATAAEFVSDQFNLAGVIETNTDQDMIRFTVPTNMRFHLNANPFNVGANNAGSNLDLQVSLYNQAQTLLNVYNPGNLLNSVIDTTLNTGTYYLKVEGKGNIYASNYASLGSYTLQGQLSSATLLPLRVLKLNGQLNGDKHQFNWIIDADEQVTDLTLEVSTDGISFRPVTQPAATDRSFIYKPNLASNAQYRLNVTFDNGRQYYSNVVTLRKTGTAPRPQLVSNLVNNHTVAVTSPGVYSYQVYNLGGTVVRKGQLSNGYNTINTAGITGGMYMIRFAGAAEQWTDKLILQ
jgi:hypothetical protein